MVLKPPRRSRGAQNLVWVALNFLRLAGVVAIIWAAAIHCVLFSKDISQSLQAQQSPLNTTVSSPGSASVMPGSRDTQSSSDPSASVTYLTMDASPNVPVPTPLSSSRSPVEVPANAPTVVFPNAVVAPGADGQTLAPTQTPIDMAEAPALPTAINARSVAERFHVTARPFESVEARNKPVKRDEGDQSTNRGGVEVDIDATDGRYYPQTTVPIQSSGLIFAIVHRALSVMLLALLLLLELGVPEVFLINTFGAFSLVSSPFWLGFAKMWMGVDMQRHYVPTNFLYPGMLLVGLGLVQTFVALPLIWNQRKINRTYPTLKSREIYLKFNEHSRLPFWKPIPELAYQRAYDTAGMAARRGGRESMMHEKRGSMSSSVDEDEYPTFSGGALSDPESQIRKLTRRQHGESWDGESQPLSAIDEEDDDEEEEEEILATTKPSYGSNEAAHAWDWDGSEKYRSPACHPSVSRRPEPGSHAMAQIPAALQGMVTGAKTRFAADQVPTIKLQPSTPSTIASGKRSIKHPGRPDSMFSTNTASTNSSSGSAQSRRINLVKEAAGNFPSPPDRAAIPARAKPKAHLVNPPVGDTRLVPPRKGHKKKGSESSGSYDAKAGKGILKSNNPVEGARPPPRRSGSNEEIDTRGIQLMQPAKHPEQDELDRWEMPKRPTSAMKRSREDTEDREEARRTTGSRRSVRFDCNKGNRGSVDSALSSDNDTGFDLSDILPKKQHQQHQRQNSNPFNDSTNPNSDHDDSDDHTSYSGDESAGYVPEMPDHPFSKSHRRGDSDTVSRSGKAKSSSRRDRRKSHMVV